MITAQHADDMFNLNKDARNLLSRLIKEQVCDKGNVFLETKVRYDYLEYYFSDGTMIEMQVVRDFDNNCNVDSVVINHYKETKCGNYYDCLYTEGFKVS